MNPFKKEVSTAWCPGCGNFQILKSLQDALDQEGLRPQDVLIVSGIGQAAKLPHYISANGFNGLHGRALPVAMGAHAANKSMKLIVTSGDGDTYGEGGNHFLHNVRRNLDILHLVHDNQVYGLTKGQGSPTTAFGQKTTLQTDGMKSMPIKPLALALSLGASFVARAFSRDTAQLVDLIRKGLQHKGYAFIDIFQPCPSFNKINTYQWYGERVCPLPDDHDPTDLQAAMKLALAEGDKLPTGIFYQVESTDFMSRQSHLQNNLIDYPKHKKDIAPLLERHR